MPEGTRLSSGASHVLVVSKSPISRIVVSGIVERAGLKAVPEMPALAPARLGGLDPELVIVDVEGDCDDLLLALRDYRRASPANKETVRHVCRSWTRPALCFAKGASVRANRVW